MKGLSPKQLQAATLLSSGLTITATAAQIELTRGTVHDWLKEDLFIAHVNNLKNEVIEAGRAQIQTSVSLAIETICNVMKDSVNDTARLAAAKEILFMSGLSRELKIGATTAEGIKKEREEAERFDYL